MPEICEIVKTSQYLLTDLKGLIIVNCKVLSGKYLNKKKIKGINLIGKSSPLKIIDINSKGKFMWFELKSIKNNETIYIMNGFGMSGEWTYDKTSNSRFSIDIKHKITDKDKITLYFTDPRNFGNIEITNDINVINKKLTSLGRDLLKTNFSEAMFNTWIKEFLDRKENNKNIPIYEVLMHQEKNKGIGSGLGNYLTPEILYMAKISPLRHIGSLKKIEINRLSKAIKYILKLCYANNKIGYMVLFEDFNNKHKEGIKKKIYPNYHSRTNIKNNEFEFKVYEQKTDPLGNPVKKVEIIKDRFAHWVPAIQK
jgi:formamidopyrimidine-DNA glycosylase